MAKYKYRHRETYKDVNIDIRANTTKDLMAKVAAKKQQIDRSTIDRNTKLSVFADLYLETYKRNSVSASWYIELERMAKRLIKIIGDKPVGKIKPIEVQSCLNSFSACSESYVKKVYDLLSQLFSYAYRNGVTTTDYTLDLERPSGKDGETGRTITSREREVLLKVLHGHRGEIFCKIMLYCGLRPGEVMALTWKDIDLKTGVLSVNKAVKKDHTVGMPKSSAGYRDIPVPDHFIRELKEVCGEPFALVCPQQNGKQHTETTRKNMWKNIKRLMNIEMGCKVFRNALVPPYPLADDFRMYNLRHTYCTDLELKGVPINIASRLMGHSDISITSRIYTHATDESLNIARLLINGTGNEMGSKNIKCWNFNG